MITKDIAFRIEQLQIESEKIDSLQETIFQAIFHGEINIDKYEWAFITLGEMTFDLKNSLEEMVNESFELARKEIKNEQSTNI